MNGTVSQPPVLLELKGITRHFPTSGPMFGPARSVKAVDGVDLIIRKGETLGLVGESGCGKSTLGRLVARLDNPTAGQMLFDGQDMAAADPRALKSLRGAIQIIFQNPFSSLNPRMTVGSILEEPLIVHRRGDGGWRRRRVAELMDQVGLRPEQANRYPHEFSGGQRQRIGIARALALEPRLIVCDEPVSALDVSIQAQIINLLEDLQARLGLSYLFISHDLSVVEHVSDRVAVMYLGRIVEEAAARDFYRQPLHPYAQALLSAVPPPDPAAVTDEIVLEGAVPSPVNPPAGCHFTTRCRHVRPECSASTPALRELAPAHRVRCRRVEEILAERGKSLP